MNPVVSVIITVYNRTQYIKQAIESVLGQSFQDFEIIVADDLKNETIEQICLSTKDNRINYYANSTNLGVALSVKKAIEVSKGQFIAILNDDDSWEPQFLEKLVSPLKAENEIILAFSNHWIIDENGIIDSEYSESNSNRYGRVGLKEGKLGNLEDFVLKKNGIPLAMAAIFRKDALNLDLIFKEVSGAYDFWISCLLASHGKPAYFCPEKLTRYRVHNDMESIRKAPDKRLNLVFVFGKLIDLKLFPNKNEFLHRKHSEILRHVGRDYLSFDQLETARGYFKKSLNSHFTFKAFTAIILSYLPKSLRTALKFI